ncbi:hypothetical protein BJ912DRAFT_934647 [Pholiota molesta]|nr:hypothetical protein BJ912DRAFT_934647 [Pholiota molesta]
MPLLSCQPRYPDLMASRFLSALRFGGGNVRGRWGWRGDGGGGGGGNGVGGGRTGRERVENKGGCGCVWMSTICRWWKSEIGFWMGSLGRRQNPPMFDTNAIQVWDRERILLRLHGPIEERSAPSLDPRPSLTDALSSWRSSRVGRPRSGISHPKVFQHENYVHDYLRNVGIRWACCSHSATWTASTAITPPRRVWTSAISRTLNCDISSFIVVPGRAGGWEWAGYCGGLGPESWRAKVQQKGQKYGVFGCVANQSQVGNRQRTLPEEQRHARGRRRDSAGWLRCWSGVDFLWTLIPSIHAGPTTAQERDERSGEADEKQGDVLRSAPFTHRHDDANRAALLALGLSQVDGGTKLSEITSNTYANALLLASRDSADRGVDAARKLGRSGPGWHNVPPAGYPPFPLEIGSCIGFVPHASDELPTENDAGHPGIYPALLSHEYIRAMPTATWHPPASYCTSQTAIMLDVFYASPGGGCDHTSPDNDSFPLIHLDPLTGNSGECLNAPTGINWTTVELNNNLVNAISYCDAIAREMLIRPKRPTCLVLGRVVLSMNSGAYLATSVNLEAAIWLLHSGNATTEVAHLGIRRRYNSYRLSVRYCSSDQSPQALPQKVRNLRLWGVRYATAVSSIQPQANIGRQKGADVWEIVAGILLGCIAVCFLIVITYCWRRCWNAMLQWILPSKPHTSVMPFVMISPPRTEKTSLTTSVPSHAMTNTVL